jgi:tetratricopeptide (TPR) repeat protein
LKQQLLRSKDRNGNCSCRDSDVEFPVTEGKKIIKRLGYLALAIDQAGAYIKGRIELDAFLDHFNHRRKVVLSKTPDIWEYRRKRNETEAEQSLNVTTTWELSFDQIAGEPNELESKRHLLTLSAFFSGQNISEEIFQISHESDTLPWMTAFVREGDWDKYKFLDMITELQNLSLVQRLDSGASTSFSLHPLIQDWMKLRLGIQECQDYAAEAMLILSNYMNSQKSDRLTLLAKQTILSHLDAALENDHTYLIQGIRLGKSSLEVPALVFARFYLYQGRYEEAEQLFGRALKSTEERLGRDHLGTLGTVHNLASVYTNQGRYREAEQLYGRVLKSTEERLGRDHPDTLVTVLDLAIVYSNQGRYKEAEQLYGRVLESTEERLGQDHPDTLGTVHNLAVQYVRQDRYEEAEQLFRRALKGREERLGRDHPDTLRTVLDLANMYADQGCYEKAEQLFGRALKGYEQRLGRDHPDTLRTAEVLYIRM